MKITTISLKDEHVEWVKDNTINLSRFVQKKIDEMIHNESGKN